MLIMALMLLVCVISYYAVGRLIPILTEKQLVDHPNHRTIHAGVVARGGGLVIVILLMASLACLGVISQRVPLFGTLVILLLAWSMLSWWDDQHDLSSRTRFLFQACFAALIMLAFGYVDQLIFTSNKQLSLSLTGAVFTWIGILWFTNLYNFMDGMDGLAAAQTIIGSLTIGFWLWQYGDQALALSCYFLAAASYGFLLWNWHPAKVFMGDVGSITIGAFFSILFVLGSHRYGFPIVSFVLLFGVFVADASVTILRRIFNRERFWEAHRSHYYQRLATAGMAHDRIVIYAIIIMLICSLFATTSLLYHDIIWLCILLEVALLVSVAFLISMREQKTVPDS